MNLAKLAEFGIKATVTQAGKLHLEAPQGTLTPELRQEIAQNRAFLLAEVESVNLVNMVNMKSSCIGSGARAYTQASDVHQPKKAAKGELGEHGELQNHLYGLARTHIYPVPQVHTQPAIDIGTRRPPDLSPTLLAASLALDAQIAASGALPVDPDRHCYPHTEAMNGVELALMATRLERFARIGLHIDQAEKLADRLKDRDRDPQDDRHICMECQHCEYGRCGNSRAAGLRQPELGADYATTLKRCSGFAPGQGTLTGASLEFVSAPPTKQLPKQQHGHPLTPDQQQASRDYHLHHFGCAKCRVSGQGRGERCAKGLALWVAYTTEEGAKS